ncbi:hypothetical protein CJ179_30830 [Rhodococcus sp. ACS1]|nr:hypothetical protein CJ179_30830 [Rhodococcus sp. ACS1]
MTSFGCSVYAVGMAAAGTVLVHHRLLDVDEHDIGVHRLFNGDQFEPWCWDPESRSRITSPETTPCVWCASARCVTRIAGCFLSGRQATDGRGGGLVGAESDSPGSSLTSTDGLSVCDDRRRSIRWGWCRISVVVPNRRCG